MPKFQFKKLANKANDGQQLPGIPFLVIEDSILEDVTSGKTPCKKQALRALVSVSESRSKMVLAGAGDDVSVSANQILFGVAT